MLNKKFEFNCAQALFEIADEKNISKEVGLELVDIEQLINNNIILNNFICHPQIPGEVKKNVIMKIFYNISIYVSNFIFVLIDRHKENTFPYIVKEYKLLLNKKYNIIDIEVITAVPLSVAEQKALEKKLSILEKKNVCLFFTVDTKLIGGIVLKTRDKFFDGSVKRQLDEIRNILFSLE